MKDAWVLVADQSEARVYSADPTTHVLSFVLRLANPQAHLHDRDLVSDRPGRVFDHAPTEGGRRGATAHHATGGERTPHRHEADLFAQRVVRALAEAHHEQRFERLVVLAGPVFLGHLRQALTPEVRRCVVGEVAKDLTHLPADAISEHLPVHTWHRAERA